MLKSHRPVVGGIRHAKSPGMPQKSLRENGFSFSGVRPLSLAQKNFGEARVFFWSAFVERARHRIEGAAQSVR